MKAENMLNWENDDEGHIRLTNRAILVNNEDFLCDCTGKNASFTNFDSRLLELPSSGTVLGKRQREESIEWKCQALNILSGRSYMCGGIQNVELPYDDPSSVAEAPKKRHYSQVPGQSVLPNYGAPNYNIRSTESQMLKIKKSMKNLIDCYKNHPSGEVALCEDKFMQYLINRKIRKEESGLSEDTFMRRIWTKDNVAPAASLSRSDQSPECCSICMVEFQDDDNVVPAASLSRSDQSPECCSICMVEFQDDDKMAMLYYCSHVYHVQCIKKWVLSRNVCPLCKSLAFIPEHFPDWEGKDIHVHQKAFQCASKGKR